MIREKIEARMREITVIVLSVMKKLEISSSSPVFIMRYVKAVSNFSLVQFVQCARRQSKTPSKS